MTYSNNHWWKPGGGGGGGSNNPDCQTMIYLGKLGDMDQTAWITGPEKAPSVLGNQSFGSSGQPLYDAMHDVTLNDPNRDGWTNVDEFGYRETISHNAGHGSYNGEIDSALLVRGATLTYLNEQNEEVTVNNAVLRVMQDMNGNTFLMPPPKGAGSNEVWLMQRPIVSITFPSNPNNYDLSHNAVYTDRHCFTKPTGPIPCFAHGTMIETEYGVMAIQDLRAGIKVWTVDNGMQPIRWIGSRKLDAVNLWGAPNLRPIRISAGALGKNIPSRDLLVSPQHRILVRSRIAQKLFGQDEVLVAAKQLLQVEGIDIATDLPEVEYFHMLFDRHEVVLSDGAETESLYTGPEAMEALGAEVREEIFTIFPQLRDMSKDDIPAGARLLASGRLGRKLAVRHANNQRALVQ